MGRWGKAVGLFVLLAVVAAGAAEDIAYPSCSWRYKMTVRVETPEGIRTGYAVREVTQKSEPYVQGLIGPSAFVSGEAVVVDLGKRGKLFALLRDDLTPDYAYFIAFRALGKEAGAMTPDGVRYFCHLKNAKAELKPQDYPMMAAFANESDPASVELAYDVKKNWLNSHDLQVQTIDNLQKIYGKGVKVKSISIETTTDPVTHRIGSVIPWLIQRINNNVGGYLGHRLTSAYDDDDPTGTYLNGSEFLSMRTK